MKSLTTTMTRTTSAELELLNLCKCTMLRNAGYAGAGIVFHDGHELLVNQ